MKRFTKELEPSALSVLAVAVLLAVLLCALAECSNAAPFLVSDPYPAAGPKPDSFSCALDSGALISIPSTVNADGTVILHYDLAAIGNGAHTAQCSATSTLWGSSAQSGKLSFSAGIPPAPNLSLSGK